MNSKDLLILAHLRNDARITLTNLSKKTNIPISTIYDRLKMQEEGFIQKHTTLIDFAKLGYNTRANITLKVDREQREAIKEYLIKHQNVNSVYKINSGYDFLIETVFKNIKDLEDFMEILDQKFKITDSQTHYIINDIKREAFMANPELLGLLDNPK
jgi:Lrp/AsnC family transcriptional regulator, leucine-responsive regulatory protein